MSWVPHGLPTFGDGNSSSSSTICQGGRVSFLKMFGRIWPGNPWLLVSKKGLDHLNRHLNRFGDLEGIRHKHRVHSRTSHQFSTAMAGAAALTMGVDDTTCMINPLGFAHWLYNGYLYINIYVCIHPLISIVKTNHPNHGTWRIPSGKRLQLVNWKITMRKKQKRS